MKRWLVGSLLLALAGVLLVIVINRSRNPVVTVEGIGTSGKGRVHTERNEQGEIVEVRIYSNNYPRPPPPAGADRLLDLFKRFLGGNGERKFVVDADLAQLKEMHHLQTLYLSGKDINGAGLVYLKRLPELRSINLFHTRATDASLVHLQGLQLSELTTPKCSWTDLGLKHWLAATDKPTRLRFGGWRITDAGLVHLKGLTELQSLDLFRTKITDAGLVYLTGLNKLEDLDLSVWVTDAGLVHLKGMTKLRLLKLYRTKVTDAGVAELKKALPNCKIYK